MESKAWRILAALVVAVGAAAGDICQSEDCARDLRIQRLNYFFDSVTPNSHEPPVTVKDVGQYITLKIGNLVKEFSFGSSQGEDQGSARQERQYYGTTGYSNYYGNTGYGLYGGGSSSTSYNGLDAALSALAFLAFGVWLFNLVLPKLQGANLDLGGIGRTSPLRQDTGRDISGVLDALVSSQDLISSIFGQSEAQGGRQLVREWFGEQLLNTAENTLLSVLQHFSGPTNDRTSYSKVTTPPVTQQMTPGSRRTSRNRRRISIGGEGLLHDALAYLGRILSTPPSEHPPPSAARQVSKDL